MPVNSFKFEKHFVLHPNKNVKIYAKDKGTNNPPYDLVSDTVTTWGVGTYAYTQLVNHLNQVFIHKLCLYLIRIFFNSLLLLNNKRKNRVY